VRISFELPYAKMTGEHDPKLKGKPYSVHVHVKQSLHPKANLRKLLEGWRGKKFDAKSIDEFKPEKLVGLACRLALVENGDFTNVDSIAPATKEEAKAMPKLFNKPIFFSLEEGEFDPDTFKLLHDKTREKISASPEFRALTDGGPGGGSQDDAPEDPGQDHAVDEDVPF
jgi:hypothetical protein